MMANNPIQDLINLENTLHELNPLKVLEKMHQGAQAIFHGGQTTEWKKVGAGKWSDYVTATNVGADGWALYQPTGEKHLTTVEVKMKPGVNEKVKFPMRQYYYSNGNIVPLKWTFVVEPGKKYSYSNGWIRGSGWNQASLDLGTLSPSKRGFLVAQYVDLDGMSILKEIEKTAKEVCEQTDGMRWYDNTCMEKNLADCLEKGRVLASDGTCLPETAKEMHECNLAASKGENKAWDSYAKECVTIEELAKRNCERQGGVMHEGQCKDPRQIKQEECQAQGLVYDPNTDSCVSHTERMKNECLAKPGMRWNESKQRCELDPQACEADPDYKVSMGKCVALTEQEKCALKVGYKWKDGECRKVTLADQKAWCEAEGGVWRNGMCDRSGLIPVSQVTVGDLKTIAGHIALPDGTKITRLDQIGPELKKSLYNKDAITLDKLEGQVPEFFALPYDFNGSQFEYEQFLKEQGVAIPTPSQLNIMKSLGKTGGGLSNFKALITATHPTGLFGLKTMDEPKSTTQGIINGIGFKALADTKHGLTIYHHNVPGDPYTDGKPNSGTRAFGGDRITSWTDTQIKYDIPMNVGGGSEGYMRRGIREVWISGTKGSTPHGKAGYKKPGMGQIVDAEVAKLPSGEGQISPHFIVYSPSGQNKIADVLKNLKDKKFLGWSPFDLTGNLAGLVTNAMVKGILSTIVGWVKKGANQGYKAIKRTFKF